jgi:hypothetical protein
VLSVRDGMGASSHAFLHSVTRGRSQLVEPPHYLTSAGGFCFDSSCADAPVQDDPLLEDYNVADIVERFTMACVLGVCL